MELKKKIFIVDDDISIHKLIMTVLPSDEFEVIQAFDGKGIEERIQSEQPDLIILDITMPVGDGRDICGNLRKNSETKKLKILILSAKDEHHERIQGLEIGADEYITKPFNVSLLGNKIRAMCGIMP